MITPRHDWSFDSICALFELPFIELIYQAQHIHRQIFKSDEIQLSTLLSIKTGACPEDCAYCPQSGHHKTSVEKESLLDLKTVLEKAKAAKAQGASRFCMGGAWRSPPKKAMPLLIKMIEEVKKLGLETCMTAGLLDASDANALAQAGLDFYNHNIDTSREYYDKIINTRTFDDRLKTLAHVRKANISVCCGGILGLGETREDRISFVKELAVMKPHPESVPINKLIAFQGTPLQEQKEIEPFEFVRTIAVTRITMPKSHIRLTAGRTSMSEEMQTLCFIAGANSIFLGDKLLTAKNPENHQDMALMQKLGLKPERHQVNKKEKNSA